MINIVRCVIAPEGCCSGPQVVHGTGKGKSRTAIMILTTFFHAKKP